MIEVIKAYSAICDDCEAYVQKYWNDKDRMIQALKEIGWKFTTRKVYCPECKDGRK